MPESHSDIPRIAILLDTTISWSRSLIQGILEYSRTNGPWYVYLEPQPSTDKLYLPAGWQGDGIIARVASKEIASHLKTLNLPVVNVSSIQVEGADYPRVITNPASEGAAAYEVFRSRGFHNFAYVGQLKEGYVNRHLKEYEKLLAENGHKLHVYNVQRRGGTGSTDRLTKWLESLLKPVGIFCWGPSLGHRVIDTCQLAGINVPHDVAVFGSDYDELLSEASHPPQSGLRVDTEQIGRTAASILHSMIQGEKPSKMEWLLEPKGIIEKLSIDTVAVEDERLSAVMRFLSEHALEQISVEDVLKAHPMSRRTLERKFRQAFGCSMVEHMRHLRINHARNLLADTDEPITSISDLCGFSSYNYLNRIFKQMTGLSPSQYRAKSRADLI
ncbi:MAG: helix-turn-helix domain-containing protein [Puniceicoccaceae bacterium]